MRGVSFNPNEGALNKSPCTAIVHLLHSHCTAIAPPLPEHKVPRLFACSQCNDEDIICTVCMEVLCESGDSDAVCVAAGDSAASLPRATASTVNAATLSAPLL